MGFSPAGGPAILGPSPAGPRQADQGCDRQCGRNPTARHRAIAPLRNRPALLPVRPLAAVRRRRAGRIERNRGVVTRTIARAAGKPIFEFREDCIEPVGGNAGAELPHCADECRLILEGLGEAVGIDEDEIGRAERARRAMQCDAHKFRGVWKAERICLLAFEFIGFERPHHPIGRRRDEDVPVADLHEQRHTPTDRSGDAGRAIDCIGSHALGFSDGIGHKVGVDLRPPTQYQRFCERLHACRDPRGIAGGPLRACLAQQLQHRLDGQPRAAIATVMRSAAVAVRDRNVGPHAALIPPDRVLVGLAARNVRGAVRAGPAGATDDRCDGPPHGPAPVGSSPASTIP